MDHHFKDDFHWVTTEESDAIYHTNEKMIDLDTNSRPLVIKYSKSTDQFGQDWVERLGKDNQIKARWKRSTYDKHTEEAEQLGLTYMGYWRLKDRARQTKK